MSKISKRTVDAMPKAVDKPVFLWDDQLHGFGVKVLPSGSKRYLVKYRTQGGGRTAPQRWLTLGTHGQITPDQARALAQQALAAVARGDDPQGSRFKLRVAPTMEDVWERFAADQLPRRKAATRGEYESQWRDLLKPRFGKERVEAVTRSEVDRFHQSLKGTPYRANRTLALLSRLFSLAEAWDMRVQGTNPCKFVERFPEQARTRFLSIAELERIGEALEQLVSEKAISGTAANAIVLLLLTGARLNEILSAEWAWVDTSRGVLSLPDSKTGAKPVYLGQQAARLLEAQRENSGQSRYVFPSATGEKHFVNLRKAWVRVCERASLENVRLHDLRHTAASIAVGTGASLVIVGRLLGHSQAQTTLRYAHVDIDPAMKAANAIGKVVGDAIPKRLGNSATIDVPPKKIAKDDDDVIIIVG